MKLEESYLILIFNLVQKEVYSKEVFQLIPRKQLKELYEVLKIEITNLYELDDENLIEIINLFKKYLNSGY